MASTGAGAAGVRAGLPGKRSDGLWCSQEHEPLILKGKELNGHRGGPLRVKCERGRWLATSACGMHPESEVYPQIQAHSFCLKMRYISVHSCKARNPRHMAVGPGGWSCLGLRWPPSWAIHSTSWASVGGVSGGLAVPFARQYKARHSSGCSSVSHDRSPSRRPTSVAYRMRQLMTPNNAVARTNRS